MARASKNVRKLRRIRRERSLAFRMADTALSQRDQARAFANLLVKELEKLQNPVEVRPEESEISSELIGGAKD